MIATKNPTSREGRVFQNACLVGRVLDNSEEQHFVQQRYLRVRFRLDGVRARLTAELAFGRSA